MRPKYYKIPLDVTQLFKKASEKPKLYVSLKTSLDQHLHLIILTGHEELKYDHEYGSLISDLDYTTEKQSGLFERSIEESLLDSIVKYEPRLKQVSVKVDYEREGALIKSGESVSFKVYIVIKISALIRQLDERYENTFKIFFSPIANG